MTTPEQGAMNTNGKKTIDRSKIVMSPDARLIILPAEALATDFYERRIILRYKDPVMLLRRTSVIRVTMNMKLCLNKVPIKEIKMKAPAYMMPS